MCYQGDTNSIRQTAEPYPLTVGSSKGIHIQYVYVGLFDASANAVQCTNVPYILSRLASTCIVRIQV